MSAQAKTHLVANAAEWPSQQASLRFGITPASINDIALDESESGDYGTEK
jgi:hypothetical protein